MDYESMTPEDVVAVDLESGRTIDQNHLKPATNTETHLALYKAFPWVGGVAHTHSVNAVAFAQAGMDISALGTTHADHFISAVPCTRELSENEVENGYTMNSRVIAEAFRLRGIDPMNTPAALVRSHGPFTWGSVPEVAVQNAVILETIAEMCIKTFQLNPGARTSEHILRKHFHRKNGPDVYYGQ